jgi:glyoxylase-like metal-dependent hydrolase (beta-lactamase superfamily II)
VRSAEERQPKVARLEVGPLQTNCYLLASADEVAVIDPGGDAAAILAALEGLGGAAKLVVNTHVHVDHIGANRPVVDSTGAALLIHEYDAPMLAEGDADLAGMMGMDLESPSPARLLRDGDTVEVGTVRLRVVHTPGHTPGSICLLADGVAFTGDTLFLDSIGRMDFPGGDEREMQASLSRLQGLLSRETMLYPGHGQPGTYARALLVNPFLGSVWPA